MAAPKDVNTLYNNLVNANDKKLKFYHLGHCTFVWGRELLYVEDLLEELD